MLKIWSIKITMVVLFLTLGTDCLAKKSLNVSSPGLSKTKSPGSAALQATPDFSQIMAELKQAEKIVDGAGKKGQKSLQKAPARALSAKKKLESDVGIPKKSDKKPSERSLSVVLDDLNKLKWKMRQTKKEKIEKRLTKKLVKAGFLDSMQEKQEPLANTHSRVAQKEQDRLLQDKFGREQSSLAQKLPEIRATQKPTPTLNRSVGQGSQTTLKNTLGTAPVQELADVSGAIQTEPLVHFNEPLNYADVHHTPIQVSRPMADIPPVIQQQAVQQMPQLLLTPPVDPPKTRTPVPRALSFEKPSFSLRSFDIASNIQELDVKIQELEVCTESIEASVTDVATFQTNEACYKDYVVTVKLLTQIELWNKKLIYEYVVTKHNFQAFQKHAGVKVEGGVQGGSQGVPAVPFSEFYKTMKSHYSEFDLKLYMNKFEGQVKLETQFYDRNYEKIQRVSQKLDKVKGIYQLHELVGEFQNEVYAFKSLNSFLDSHNTRPGLPQVKKGGFLNLPDLARPSQVRIVGKSPFSRPNFVSGKPAGCKVTRRPPIVQPQMSQKEKYDLAEDAIAMATGTRTENKVVAIPDPTPLVVRPVVAVVSHSQNNSKDEFLDDSQPKIVAQITVEDTEEIEQPSQAPTAVVAIQPVVEEVHVIPVLPQPPVVIQTPTPTPVIPKPVDLSLPGLNLEPTTPQPSLADLTLKIQSLLHQLESANAIAHVPVDDSCKDEKTLEVKKSLDTLLQQTDAAALATKNTEECKEEPTPDGKILAEAAGLVPTLNPLGQPDVFVGSEEHLIDVQSVDQVHAAAKSLPVITTKTVPALTEEQAMAHLDKFSNEIDAIDRSRIEIGGVVELIPSLDSIPTPKPDTPTPTIRTPVSLPSPTSLPNFPKYAAQIGHQHIKRRPHVPKWKKTQRSLNAKKTAQKKKSDNKKAAQPSFLTRQSMSEFLPKLNGSPLGSKLIPQASPAINRRLVDLLTGTRPSNARKIIMKVPAKAQKAPAKAAKSFASHRSNRILQAKPLVYSRQRKIRRI